MGSPKVRLAVKKPHEEVEKQLHILWNKPDLKLSALCFSCHILISGECDNDRRKSPQLQILGSRLGNARERLRPCVGWWEISLTLRVGKGQTG